MFTDDEILTAWQNGLDNLKDVAISTSTAALKKTIVARAILKADLKARQAAMTQGLNLFDVFNKAEDKVPGANLCATEEERVAFIRNVMEQITDFKTTPSSGPVPNIEKLEALHDAEKRVLNEIDYYLVDHMTQLGFETVNDNASVFACTLSQVHALLEARTPKTAELVNWEAICERALVAICEGKKYLGILESDVIAVGALIESVGLSRTAAEKHVEPWPENKFPAQPTSSNGITTDVDPADLGNGVREEAIPSNIKISRHGVAVDQSYFWNYDMAVCPRGVKVQLLGFGGLPAYGHYKPGDKFWMAWAALPKTKTK